MIEAIGTACAIGFDDDMNESIMTDATISDYTFRMALDKALKRQNILKKERDKRIGEFLIRTSPHGRDEVLDMIESQSNEYEQEKRKSKECPLEDVEQIETVLWWRHTYPEHKIICCWNGGTRTPKERAQQKLLGIEPGVSDLQVRAFDLWIEMKRVDPKLCNWSEEQQKWKRYVESDGGTYILAYGFEDAKRQLIPFMERKLSELACVSDESFLLSK